MKKEKHVVKRVNMCWQLKDEKKCVTLPREHAYETKEWVEEQGGCVFWFMGLDD